MSNDTTNQVAPVVLTPKQNLENVTAVRDLFARAHDYIAQASHPGHLGGKVAEVLNFLAFQYNDFKIRTENLEKQIAAEAKAELSKVDVEAAKAAVDAVLVSPVAAPDAAQTPKA